MKSWLFTIMTMTLLLTGGRMAYDAPVPSFQVVTQVTVQSDMGQVVRYRDQGKMSKILNYLRHTDPWDPPAEDPGPLRPSFLITVSLSDGSQVQYVQKGTEYLRRDQGPWMKVHPERALRLWLILAAVPGDPVMEPDVPSIPPPGTQPVPAHHE